MCSRFTATRTKLEIELQFGMAVGFDYFPRYNIAPGQFVPVIRPTPKGREMVLLRWGLIPKWTKANSTMPGLINAKSETAGEKPSFQEAADKRRCVVIADGFVEWETVAGQKQPNWFKLTDGKPFGFAALWEPPAPKGKFPDDPTVAILTVAANPDVSMIHDRMPAILPVDKFETWLNPDGNWDDVKDLLQPLPAGSLTSTFISREINKASVGDRPDLLLPVVSGLFG